MNTPEERLILVGAEPEDRQRMEASLSELEALAHTAGATAVGRVIQMRSDFHPATYIGSGKIEEIRNLLWETDATGVLFDDELTPRQMKNLEDSLDVKVIDRTILILDIFALHATTREGKLQVELAQARYSLTRLQGAGKNLSRLGGGIGTRGPGESKLETDRRRIRNRIGQLKKEIADLSGHRERTRNERSKRKLPVAAIVGYTNAGKSTLLNALTHAGVLSENKLFATLDPTTRLFRLPSGKNLLLTDTVGFISKLPHHLIDAFRSTLEEARYADLIIHVADLSNPDIDAQTQVVYDTLTGLDVTGKPIITVYNKTDLVPEKLPPRDPYAEKTVSLSAFTGKGLETLGEALENMLSSSQVFAEYFFPFNEAGILQDIRKYGQLLSEEYSENGIFVKAFLPEELNNKIRKQKEGS